MVNDRKGRQSSKMDLSQPRDIMKQCHEAERRECSQSMMNEKREISSAKGDIAQSRDGKCLPVRVESREFSQQRSSNWPVRRSSNMDISKPKIYTQHSSKAENREYNQQQTGNWPDRRSRKLDLYKPKDYTEHCSKTEPENRECSQQQTSNWPDRRSSKMDLSKPKDVSEYCNKAENREFSQQQTSNWPARQCSKMDISKPKDVTEYCNKAENREFSQQQTSNWPDRRSSKMDLSKPKDVTEYCNKAENKCEGAGREFSQQQKSNWPDRHSSKMDLSKPKDVTEYCNKAENKCEGAGRQFDQQWTSNWPDRRSSKMDISKPKDVTEYCNKAENRDCSQTTSECRDCPSTKMDMSGLRSHRSNSENRTSSQQSAQRYEMQSCKMEFCPIQDFNNSANKKERRQMSPPIITQREERSTSRVNFNISTECNDYDNKRQNRESSQPLSNQTFEKLPAKIEVTISEDGKNHCTSSVSRACSPIPREIEHPPSHFQLTMECCSPQVINQRRERPGLKEEFPCSAEFKDCPSKRENREFTHLEGSPSPETPFSRKDMPGLWDGRDRSMISENRTEYKSTGDRPFNNCKTFLPEQSSTRLSTNIPIVLRTPFGTLQSQSRTSYDTLRKMNSIRNRAAITIQAHWRGYATRQRLRRHASRNQPQAASGGYKAQKNPSSEHKSTTLNQPNYRSYQNRDDLRAQDLRAAQIQKEWREFLQRQQTEKNKSPVSVQTHYKDHKSAMEVFVKIRAATIIQSWFRGFKVRKALKEKKQASSLRLGRSSNRFSFRRPSSNSLRKSASQPMASSSRSGLKPSTVPVKSEASWMSADLKSDKGRNLPQKQHSVSKNSEGVGQSSFSGENPNSNWTEDVEKEDGCCKNVSVAQLMETQPRFKFETMEDRTYHKPGTNSKPLVQCRPSIPIMTFSTQYHCRNTMTPGNSSLVPQDRSRERVKSSCDIPWSEKSKVILPYRSDHRPSGHAYGSEPFRKRQARSYPNNQLSNTLFERRKSLYEGKMIEPYKYPQNNPPVQVPGPSFGWRKMSYCNSSEPQFQQCFKGKDRTFCDRQNDQENISPSREEHQGSVSLYNTDMCSIKSARDSVLGPTCCQQIEKTMPSYDNRSNVNIPPTFPSHSDNCMRKVTCDRFTDIPLYRQRELNASLMDNEPEEQDRHFPSGTVHTSPEYIGNSIKTKADFGKFHEQSQGRMHEWAQNNNHNSQDAQSQPACGPAGLSHRKCSQQLFHRSFTEGINGTNIQCAWKGIQSRVALKRQNDAATQIQACFRGYMVRKYLRSSGILNRNHDEEATRKEPKAAGDNQRFSIPSQLSPKRDNSSHHLQNYESHFHSSRQSYHALQGTVEKEVPSIRYSRSSFA